MSVLSIRKWEVFPGVENTARHTRRMANDDFVHAYIRQGQYSSTVCMPVSLADLHEKIKLQLQVIENTVQYCAVQYA